LTQLSDSLSPFSLDFLLLSSSTAEPATLSVEYLFLKLTSWAQEREGEFARFSGYSLLILPSPKALLDQAKRRSEEFLIRNLAILLTSAGIGIELC
jgi:hypothetical protein